MTTITMPRSCRIEFFISEYNVSVGDFVKHQSIIYIIYTKIKHGFLDYLLN